MKKKYGALTLLGILILMFHVCQGREDYDLNMTKGTKFLEVKYNDDKPQNTKILTSFNQDLSITKEGWWPLQFQVDNEGNIFICYGRNPKYISKYNKEGIEVLKKSFPKGQGPGEFYNFDFSLSNDGRVFIADASQRRLTVLNKNMEIEEIRKMKFWGGLFTLDSKDNMFFLKMEFLPKTRDRQKLILTKFSPLGIPIKRYHEYEWGFHKDSISGIRHTKGFRPQIRFRLDNNDDLYYAMTDNYEIHIFSSDGIPLKKIIKKNIPRDLTSEEVENIKSRSVTPRIVYDIPDKVPYIADFLVLENKYLLVITFESKDETYLSGDLFDDDGIFLTGVKVPKYFNWNILDSPNKTNAVYKNKSFYTIESEEDETIFYVRRYKMIFEEWD